MISLILILCLSAGAFPKQMIENLEKPLHKNSRRVLKLKKEMRIADEQGGFYFKAPENIKISPEGCIFVLDEEQFLKFDGNGKFMKNLFRKGEGPGEFQRIENYLFHEGKIVVHHARPSKIVIMDADGNLIKEFKPEKPVSRLISYFGQKLLMARSSFPVLKKGGAEPEVIDVEWSLLSVSMEGKVEETGLVFPTKWYAKRLPNAIVANAITELSCTPFKDNFIVLHHTRDYLLKLLDMEKNKILRTFRRDYKSVTYDHGKAGVKEVKPHTYTLEPPVDSHNDIQKVLIAKGNIWVLTSTWEKEKGILVDVFNEGGQYLDSFHLPLSGRIALKDLSRHPITISDDSLFIIETDANEIPSLVKYKIID